jgi:hypothetical protein
MSNLAAIEEALKRRTKALGEQSFNSVYPLQKPAVEKETAECAYRRIRDELFNLIDCAIKKPTSTEQLETLRDCMNEIVEDRFGLFATSSPEAREIVENAAAARAKSIDYYKQCIEERIPEWEWERAVKTEAQNMICEIARLIISRRP